MELELLQMIQKLKSPLLDTLFRNITMLGEERFALSLCAVVFWCIGKKAGYRLLFIYVAGAGVNEGLKNIFCAPRPIGQPGIQSLYTETATGYSFPSGHTQNTTSLWVSIMQQWPRKQLRVIGISMILLIGFSRMYLGLHWPVDVLAGILAGTLWVYAANRIFDAMVHIRLLAALPVVVGAVLLGFALVPGAEYYKIAGAVLGFAAGFAAERRYVCFDAHSGFMIQLVKCIIGFAGIFLLTEGLKVLLPDHPIYNILRYFAVSFWVIAAAPALFRRIFTPERQNS